MKKKNILITLASTTALLCVGGAFAMNAGKSVSAATPSQQKMLGASILVANDKTGIDSNGIRFPVVVADEVAEKITESKVYVLPADHWTGAEAPTAEQVVEDGEVFETTDKWVDYYEQDMGYGDEYSEAVVYMYNIPTSKYATDFYVCSWMKLDDDTEELSDVIGRSMTYVAQKAVESGAYSTDDLGNYINATYTVNKYLRTVYGSYELTGETTTVDNGVIGEIPTVDGVDGYTLNEKLTKEANEFYDGATLNLYYENDDYTFMPMGLRGNNNAAGYTTITDTKMVNVAPENVRDVDYLVKDKSNAGPVQHSFSYKASYVGNYLMLNAYWVECPNQFGFVVWDNVNEEEENITTSVTLYYAHDTLFEPTVSNVVGKWTTIAVYLDAQYFKAQDSTFYISFDNWSAAKVYLGEYTVITPDEFKANYEQPAPPPEEIASGVVKYTIDNLENNNNLVSLKGVKNYEAGSRVAIRAKNDKGVDVKMYNGNGGTIRASEIYNDDGVAVNSVLANTYYTYVFYIDTALTVSDTAGKMFADTTDTSVVLECSNAYIINDDIACVNFRSTVFGANAINSIRYYTPSQIEPFSAADAGTYVQNADGTATYTTSSNNWDARVFKLIDTTSIQKGTFLVLKLKFTAAPSARTYQAAISGTDNYNFRPWYTAADRGYLGWDNYELSSEYSNQWLYATCGWRFDITEVSKYWGSFGLYTASATAKVAGNKVDIAGAYLMSESAYKQYFNITTEQIISY